MTISPPDQGLPADTPGNAEAEAVTPLLRTLGDADAAGCADGFCAVPPQESQSTGAKQ